MKLFGTLSILTIVCFSCEKHAAPIANFEFTNTELIAGKSYTFYNTSQGKIYNVLWWFGNESSTLNNVQFTPVCEGKSIVSLTVTGPGGSDVLEKEITVVPYTTSCSRYNESTIMSRTNITKIRSKNLSSGDLYLINNISPPIRFEFFNPNQWLNCNYKPSDAVLISTRDIVTGIVNNNSPLVVTPETGVRVYDANNIYSCIFPIYEVGKYSVVNNRPRYEIKAGNVFLGTR